MNNSSSSSHSSYSVQFYFKFRFGVWLLRVLSTASPTKASRLSLTSASARRTAPSSLLWPSVEGPGDLGSEENPVQVTPSSSLPGLGARHQLAALPQLHLPPRGDQ